MAGSDHVNQTQFSPETVNTNRSPRFESPTADAGVPRDNSFNPNLLSTAYGHSETPIDHPGQMSPERRQIEVGRAAARVVQSQVNSGRNPSEGGAGARLVGSSGNMHTYEHANGQREARHTSLPAPGTAGDHQLQNDRILDNGEKFYSHDAHGSALAIAGGFGYDSPEHRALRATGGHSEDRRRDYGNRQSEAQIQGHNNFLNDMDKHRASNPNDPGVQLHQQRTANIRGTVNGLSGGDVHKAAAELAVTSPQNPWEKNVQDAFELRDLEAKHPQTAADVQNWQGKKPEGTKVTTEGVLPPVEGPGKKPDKSASAEDVSAYNSRKSSAQAEDARREGITMSVNHLPFSTIKAGMDIQRGGDSEKYVATDDTHRVKIGNFLNNIKNPYGGAQIPGTRDSNLSPGQFGSHGDHMAEHWGEAGRVNQDNRMSQGTFEGHAGQGNRNVTVDFRAHDIATGYATPTNLAPGLSEPKTTKARGAAGQKYDLLNEAHGAAADYVNTHHSEHHVGGMPLNPAQLQGTTWTRDRVHQNMQMGGSGTGVGLVHEETGTASGEKGSTGKGKTASRNSKPIGQPESPGEKPQMTRYFEARNIAKKD